MKKKNKILEMLDKGKTVDDLVDALDMRKQTIQAMIEQLAHEGLLEDATCNSGCSICPYSGSCSSSSGREKLYVVDETDRK